MKNIKLEILYDGTDFFGWQEQNTKEHVPTIEDCLKKALYKVYKKNIKLFAASRTDSGVHAKNQVVSFNAPFDIPVKKIPNTLNKFLPGSIRVYSAELMPALFNARRDARGKVYIYRVLNSSNLCSPFEFKYSYHVKYKMNISRMIKCIQCFIDNNDFRAFTTADDKRKTAKINLYHIKIIKHKEMIYIGIHGRSFLHKMIRFIVGALVEVGRGSWKTEYIQDMFKTGKRIHPLKLAPAKGLFLKRVIY